MKMNTLSLFPSLFHLIEGDNFSGIKNKLIDWIYDYKNENISESKSNKGGWQSDAYFIQKDNSFNPFFKYVEKILEEYGKVYPVGTKFGLKNAWINVNPTGTYNTTHTHPQSTISGVLWVKCPENCGNIVFESPVDYTQYELMEKTISDITNKYNYFPTYFFNPVEGSMILFPSDIRHSVEENKSKEDRISIAFNLEFVRG